MTRALVAILIVAFCSVGGIYGYRELRGVGDDMPVYVVREQAFQRTVVAEGVLNAAVSTPVTAPGAQHRYTISWLASDGSRVEKGDVVAKFEAATFERELADGLSDLEMARSARARDLEQGEQTLRSRRRTAELAKEELNQVAEFQSQDGEIYSRHQIVESQIDRELSESKLGHAARSESIEKRISRSKLDLHAVKTREAELRISKARDQLKNLEVTAPQSGVFVVERDWRGNPIQTGDTAWPGMPLAGIPQTSEMEAEVFVLEADGGGLKEGLSAKFTLEADPTQTLEATIKSVDKLAKRRVRGSPVQYFAVKLNVPEKHEWMKPGQRVVATIEVANDTAMIVPRQAVFEFAGALVVFRKIGPFYQPVEVTLGDSTPGRVIIDGALGEGERIALRDPWATAEPSDGSTDKAAPAGGTD